MVERCKDKDQLFFSIKKGGGGGGKEKKHLVLIKSVSNDVKRIL